MDPEPSTSYSLESVASISGHTDRCWSLDWHPNQPILASCSGDKSVRLIKYQALSAKFPPSSSELTKSHSRTVRSLSWSPRGKMLATASFDSTVGIWCRVTEDGIDDAEESGEESDGDEGEWECVSTLEGHESEVKSVVWSHDGTLLATCGRDKSVWIWEVTPGGEDFECMAVLMDHSQDVKQVAWHPTEELLASASYDDNLRIYQCDVASDDWSSSHTLSGHNSTVWAITFSPCGNYLASSCEDSSIKIWARNRLSQEELPDRATVFRISASDKEKWECVQTIEGVFERAVYSIDWAPSPFSSGEQDLGCIAATGSDGTIAIWAVNKSETSKVSTSLLASIEDAHTISDINCVKWCTTQPTAPRKRQSSDPEEDDGMDQQRADQTYASRAKESLKGLLATAGDDGLVKVWRLVRND